jgi:hypothetical protein
MAQKMVTPLATSLVHLQRNNNFQNMVCILEFFGLATVLTTFKKLGDFSESSGHPVPGVDLKKYCGKFTHRLF